MVDAKGIEEVILFLRILWPAHEVPCSKELNRLLLLGDIFWAAVGLYDVCSF